MQTIRKKILLLALSVAVMLTFSGCGNNNSLGISEEKSIDLEADKLLSQDTYMLSNERFSLNLDGETTHFTLTDLQTGVRYSSVPDFECNIIADETQRRFVSELSITYFDTNSTSHFMCSTSDSVEMGGATVESDGERIRVTYIFGETNREEFVPAVLTEEDFNQIYEKLSNSQKRRLKLFYIFYSAEDPPSDFEEKAELYPVLESKSLYILSDKIFDADRTNIDAYMKAAEYTEEDYLKSTESLAIAEKQEESAGFTIPVEYSLNKKGLTAKILTDLITETTEDFKLATIELLPFFAARNNTEDGYFLVPDGSGAIIPMNSVAEDYYNRRIYGDDVSLYKEQQNVLSEGQTMPVFGMSSTNGAYLAIVEGAASTANINIASYSSFNPANSGWITFNYRIVEAEKNTQMASGQGSAEGIYNIYKKAGFTELPSVTYVFDESQITYSDMADTYRTYLTEKGVLEKTQEKMPILLDFICGYSAEKSVMGVSYTDTITMTTLEQVKDILSELYKKGVENISIRLFGYSDGGIYHGAYTDFSISKDVGTKEELKELSQLVVEHGGQLYLEADFQTVYDDKVGDRYSQRADSAYYVNKRIVAVKDYHVVTRELLKEKSASFVTPNLYESFSKMFLKDIADMDVNVSYINAGKLLGGDYSDKAFVSRDAAKNQIMETIKGAKQSKKVLIGGSNEYAVLQADVATDVNIASSMFDIEKQTVPFWQMVFHGSLAYSSEASNLTENQSIHDLKALEYGCGLHYTIMGASDEILLGQTLQERYHSLSYENWGDIIAKQYQSHIDFYNHIAGSEMISHEQIADDVYRTQYENGGFSVVNYGDAEYIGDNYTVESHGYYLKGGN